MKTEDLALNVRQIFDKKRAQYNNHDVARMRYLCKTFVEFVLDKGK